MNSRRVQARQVFPEGQRNSAGCSSRFIAPCIGNDRLPASRQPIHFELEPMFRALMVFGDTANVDLLAENALLCFEGPGSDVPKEDFERLNCAHRCWRRVRVLARRTCSYPT